MKKNILFLLLAIVFISASAAVASSMPFFDEFSHGNRKIWGLDLSHHQGVIDWDLLAKQKPNFIFFKATEGVSKN